MKNELFKTNNLIPEEELWLYALENEKLVEEITHSLQEAASINLGSFKKYAKGKSLRKRRRTSTKS